MKTTSMKDSIGIKKPQFTSRIIVTPNTTSNKNGPKLNYTRRGNSSDTYRDNNSGAAMKIQQEPNGDNEVTGLSSLITQAAKTGRPSTSGTFVQLQQNVNQSGQAR